jgi:hypothetical protein
MLVPDETIKSCESILELLDLRKKYQEKNPKLEDFTLPEDVFALRSDLKEKVHLIHHFLSSVLDLMNDKLMNIKIFRDPFSSQMVFLELLVKTERVH